MPTVRASGTTDDVVRLRMVVMSWSRVLASAAAGFPIERARASDNPSTLAVDNERERDRDPTSTPDELASISGDLYHKDEIIVSLNK